MAMHNFMIRRRHNVRKAGNEFFLRLICYIQIVFVQQSG